MAYMKCNGCGARIPVRGAVCPFCQRDKTAQVRIEGNQQGAIAFAMVPVMLGAVVGKLTGFGGWRGAFIGLVLVLLIWIVVNYKSSGEWSRYSRPPQFPPAPDVNVVSVTVPRPAEVQNSAPSDGVAIRDRLTTLKSLHAEGLLSDDEYAAKKKDVLDTHL